jgi:hypothetical protein
MVCLPCGACNICRLCGNVDQRGVDEEGGLEQDRLSVFLSLTETKLEYGA